MHDFATSRTYGDEGEALIAAWLGRQGWDIEPATMQQQRQGIDLIGHNRYSHVDKTWEVKTDTAAHRTGNAFVETLSNDRTNKPGWALTCSADVLLYWVPGLETVWGFSPNAIREKLATWRLWCDAMSVKNRNYNTVGLLVPMTEFTRYAHLSAPIKRAGHGSDQPTFNLYKDYAKKPQSATSSQRKLHTRRN